MSNGIIVGRTLVFNNDLDPEWDEIIYVEVHNAKDRLTLEVMDYQHLSKARPLGSTILSLDPLICEGPDKVESPWISTGKRNYNEALRTGPKKSPKGSVGASAAQFLVTSSSLTVNENNRLNLKLNSILAPISRSLCSPSKNPSRQLSPKSQS